MIKDMSIEINAILERRGSVFLAGEDVTVQVIFKNRNPNGKKSLAWSCVQLHCEEYYTTSNNEIEKRRRQKHSSTAVTKSKQAIFSSEPVILFCDLTLEADKSEKFDSTHQIPLLPLPPNFKGHFVKYLWYMSVAAQQVDAPIKMIQLPIKVLNVGVDVDEQKASISNPFLRNEATKPSIIEIAIGRIEEICSVRKKRFYEINSAGTVFAKIIIFKNTFKLGDDVFGKLEFPQEEVHCLQTLIRAETVETNLSDDQKAENIQSHGTEHGVTAFVKETYFKIQIPLTAIPSFTTNFVKVRWRIHFEFVTTRQVLMNAAGGQQQGALKLTEDLQIETMKWDLPINILACNPLNVSLVYPISHPTSFII